MEPSDATQSRYGQVLALLNEGENEDRWMLGELVRITAERAQEKAAAEMDVSVVAFRDLLLDGADLAFPPVAEREERGS